MKPLVPIVLALTGVMDVVLSFALPEAQLPLLVSGMSLMALAAFLWIKKVKK